MTHGECNGQFLERCISSTFADAVDGAFDLAGAGGDRGERIGDSEAEIVVTMRAESDVFMRAEVLANFCEHGGVLGGNCVADGVWQINNCGTGDGGDSNDPAEKVHVAAAGVFRGKFYFGAVIARVADHLSDGVQRVLASDAQFIFQMKIGCS